MGWSWNYFRDVESPPARVGKSPSSRLGASCENSEGYSGGSFPSAVFGGLRKGTGALKGLDEDALELEIF